jgi:hypothetical protein
MTAAMMVSVVSIGILCPPEVAPLLASPAVDRLDLNQKGTLDSSIAIQLYINS